MTYSNTIREIFCDDRRTCVIEVSNCVFLELQTELGQEDQDSTLVIERDSWGAIIIHKKNYVIDAIPLKNKLSCLSSAIERIKDEL